STGVRARMCRASRSGRAPATQPAAGRRCGGMRPRFSPYVRHSAGRDRRDCRGISGLSTHRQHSNASRSSPMPRSILTAAMVLALASAPAWSAELFVSTSGNDSSADGSTSRPYRTIQRAISDSRAGDTVTVRAPSGNRTYGECVRLRHRLTLRSPSGERAHIQCSASNAGASAAQVDPGASGSRIANLEISGGYNYGIMLQTDWYQGDPPSVTGASNVVMEDLLIHGTGRDGIKITPKSNGATIRRVEIRNTGARDSGN